MNIGDRFEKDGKTYEVTSVNPWGIGYKKVANEVFEVFEVSEEVKEPEKPVRKPRKRTTK